MPIKPTPRTPGVRYVDVRVAIPDDIPFSASNEAAMGYLRSFVPLPPKATAMQSASPYTFIPLAPNDDLNETTRAAEAKGPFRPPTSPLDFRKAAASPALTATTANSSFSSLGYDIPDSRIATPSAFTSGFVSPIATPTIFEGQICRPVASSFKSTPEPSGSIAANTPRKNADLLKPRAKSPFVQQNDDATRKQRVKTELCMHFERGTPCPFGDGCVFAHGEQELVLTKLSDLGQAGLVDVETYRTKPCFTWVATGSCPFGKRCSQLHDKKVAGDSASWLPHTETKGNSIATDINVESLHQKNLYSLLYGNPFNFKGELDAQQIYGRVCNIRGGRRCISSLHEIDIALQMLGSHSLSCWKFRPQHILHQEPIMVLQKRAFRLDPGNATEIPLSQSQSQSHSPEHVLVWEIAFAPNGAEGSTLVRPVALYFTIEEEEVFECTPQQAKRYRWKPKSKSNKKEVQNPKLDQLEGFVLNRPHDRDAFALTRSILQHRLAVLRAAKTFPSVGRFKAQKALEIEKSKLENRIKAQIMHWTRWDWPINKDRIPITEDTVVPSVEGDYVPTGTGAHSDCAAVWQSLVSLNFASSGSVASSSSPEKSEPWKCYTKEKKRLWIFRRLARGEGISLDRSLPHISRAPHNSNAALPDMASERCWESLLLQQDLVESSEWDIVRDHFEKSRSKKVLSILQQ